MIHMHILGGELSARLMSGLSGEDRSAGILVSTWACAHLTPASYEYTSSTTDIDHDPQVAGALMLNRCKPLLLLSVYDLCRRPVSSKIWLGGG